MSLRYALLRIGMRTLGRLSDGIRLGWDTGFDSGRMLDYVYRDRAGGVTPLGVLFDRLYLDHPVWKGTRARREILIRHLTDALGHHQRPVVFDTAAGQGSYLLALPRTGGTYWAGDFSEAEVRAGDERARREGRDDIRFVRADAFDPATWPVRRADVLVTSGFFDILTEPAQFQRVLDAGTSVTEPGARWVFTMMEAHTDLALLREVLVNRDQRPWIAVLRPADDIVGWAESRGWRLERLEREPYRFFAVGTLFRR